MDDDDDNTKEVFDDPIIIEYRGQYDYDGLLSLIRGFYASMKIDIKEPKFKYKMKGSGAEVEFEFEGDRKVTHYIRIHLFVEGHLWDVNPQEVTVNGQKQMLTSGKFQLKIRGEYEPDFRGGYSKKWAHKQMKKFIEDPNVGLQYGDIKANGKKFMEKKLTELDTKIKEFLGMQCY